MMHGIVSLGGLCMETPKQPPNETDPEKEYNPDRWVPVAYEKKKVTPFLSVFSALIAVAVCGALFYYMGYQVEKEELQHTAYEIATAAAEQAATENSRELYQTVAVQLATQKQKDHDFTLKSVELDIIPLGNSEIRIIRVSVEGRFLFSTINVSWWVRQ